MRATSVVLLFVMLTACVNPREQCIAEAERDLRILQSLIAETQGNLERGYALEERQELFVLRQTCKAVDPNGRPFTYSCDTPSTHTTRVPVAVDLNAEASILASMEERIIIQKERTDQAVLACLANTPA